MVKRFVPKLVIKRELQNDLCPLRNIMLRFQINTIQFLSQFKLNIIHLSLSWKFVHNFKLFETSEMTILLT